MAKSLAVLWENRITCRYRKLFVSIKKFNKKILYSENSVKFISGQPQTGSTMRGPINRHIADFEKNGRFLSFSSKKFIVFMLLNFGKFSLILHFLCHFLTYFSTLVIFLFEIYYFVTKYYFKH